MSIVRYLLDCKEIICIASHHGFIVFKSSNAQNYRRRSETLA